MQTTAIMEAGQSFNDTVYYYVKDYQGNVRNVVREDGAVVESNEYYPYGGLFSAAPSVQPYKYGAKELDRTHGLDWYDSKARFYDPLLGRTNSMDKKAGDYTWLSPYLWCAANPIRFTDPDGRIVIVSVGNEPIGTTTINLYSNSELNKGNIVGKTTIEVPVYEVAISNESGSSSIFYFTRIGYRKNYNNQKEPATEVTFDVVNDGDSYNGVIKSRWKGTDNVLEFRDNGNANNQTISGKKANVIANRTAIQFHVKGATDGCLMSVGKNQIRNSTKKIRENLPNTSTEAQNSFMKEIKKYIKEDVKNSFSSNIKVSFKQLYPE